MKIYVFGNEDVVDDKAAIGTAKKIKIKDVEFVFIEPNGDIPAIEEMIIMDMVYGISKITILDEKSLGKISFMRVSAHDYDLGFQLRYLQKVGKLKKVKIIGLPMNEQIDVAQVQSILRKLVAQDMQGS